MLQYVAKRLLQTIPTLFGVATLVFLILYLVPGDPVTAILGEKAGLAPVEEIRHNLGLDLPFPVRYLRFLGGLVRGDLGRSLVTGQPVITEIASRAPATIELTVAGLIFSVTVGVAVGVLSATRRYSVLDYVVTSGAVVGISIPAFWLGMLLIIVFSIFLGWLPMSGRIEPALLFRPVTNFLVIDALLSRDVEALLDVAKHLLLPAVVVNLGGLAVLARMTRSCVLEVLGEDYVRTARAKGLSEKVVIYRHALRNALIPVVTIVGLQFGGLLAGAVITETVFAWPGLGRLVVNSIYARDYPVVQGAVVIFAAVFVLMNLAVDLLYGLLDPRIRHG